MGVVTWVDPNDCDPPHGLDFSTPHDADKVNMLIGAFLGSGFDKSKPALVGYPLKRRIQLLSGTHRHWAARWAKVKLPVVLWLRSDVEMAWGETVDWLHVMQDVPVFELETWTREHLVYQTAKRKALRLAENNHG